MENVTTAKSSLNDATLAAALTTVGDEKLRHYLTTCPGCGDEALKIYEAMDVITAKLLSNQRAIDSTLDDLAKVIRNG